MNNKNSAVYVTYQDFPANTANSIQTISTCKYFSRFNLKTDLIFPLRSKESSDNFQLIKEHYDIEEEIFNVIGLKHKRKFEGYKYFKKLNYILNHIFWSRSAVRYILKNGFEPNFFFTRSEWIFYFLSRKDRKVIYECHQITKIRKLIINISIKRKNSKIIFLNKFIHEDSGVKNLDKKILIQQNGFDSDYFYRNKIKKDKLSVIFCGNLLRLGEGRGLDFIIKSFKDPLLKDFNLKIVGGTQKEVANFSKKYSDVTNVVFLPHLSKKKLALHLNESEIGLLVNSKNTHSLFYTDPLKFYEYLSCELKVLAVDFPSHRALEKYLNIYFFDNENKSDFIRKIIDVSQKEFKTSSKPKVPNMNERVLNILDFVK